MVETQHAAELSKLAFWKLSAPREFHQDAFGALYTILITIILSEGPPMNLRISMHVRGFHHVSVKSTQL
jgi:hypothetical protein